DGSFVLFRTRVVGTNFSVRSVVDRRCGGGASVPPGASAAGWTGSVQRIFVAPFASEGGGAGTRALCARAARWGSPIADRHGKASRRAPADFGQMGIDHRRNGAHARSSAVI